jgi:hypothetical protein
MTEQERDAIVAALHERIKQGTRGYGQYQPMAKLDLKQLLGLGLKAMVEDAKGKLLVLEGMKALAEAAAKEKREEASPRVPLGDVEVNVDPTYRAQLWYFAGRGGALVFYPTKMAAEIAARVSFPDESEDTRYSRIFYKTFIQED